jgi:type I restriction enzyme S subunit
MPFRDLFKNRPSDWLLVPFSEAIDFQEGPGILAKDFRASGIPLLRLASIEERRTSFAGCNYLDPATVAKRWDHFRLRESDVLLSTSATLGRTSVVSKEQEGSICYTGIIRMRPKRADVNAAYIQYFLESPAFQQQALAVGSGSVLAHFGPIHLKELWIALPPLAEQQATVAILGALDGKLDLNRQTNRTIEAIQRALFKSWFVDFDPVVAKAAGREPPGLDPEAAAEFPARFYEGASDPIPDGWRLSPIYDVADVVYGAPFSSQHFNVERRGLPLLRIRDLVSQSPEVFTDELHPKGTSVKQGDIVVGMDGEFRAVIWHGPEAWLNQRVCHFVPKGSAGTSFVYYSIVEPLTEFERTKVGTTVTHLGKADIDTFRIVHPGDGLLARFTAVTQPLIDRMLANAAESRVLSELRDYLLPRLLSGEIRVGQAHDLVEQVT